MSSKQNINRNSLFFTQPHTIHLVISLNLRATSVRIQAWHINNTHFGSEQGSPPIIFLWWRLQARLKKNFVFLSQPPVYLCMWQQWWQASKQADLRHLGWLNWVGCLSEAHTASMPSPTMVMNTRSHQTSLTTLGPSMFWVVAQASALQCIPLSLLPWADLRVAVAVFSSWTQRMNKNEIVGHWEKYYIRNSQRQNAGLRDAITKVSVIIGVSGGMVVWSSLHLLQHPDTTSAAAITI